MENKREKILTKRVNVHQTCHRR